MNQQLRNDGLQLAIQENNKKLDEQNELIKQVIGLGLIVLFIIIVLLIVFGYEVYHDNFANNVVAALGRC